MAPSSGTDWTADERVHIGRLETFATVQIIGKCNVASPMRVTLGA